MDRAGRGRGECVVLCVQNASKCVQNASKCVQNDTWTAPLALSVSSCVCDVFVCTCVMCVCELCVKLILFMFETPHTLRIPWTRESAWWESA